MGRCKEFGTAKAKLKLIIVFRYQLMDDQPRS